MKIPVIWIPFGIVFVLYFFLAYVLGATAKTYYPYNPYYDYDFGYAKLPSSIKQVTVTLPPRFRNHGGRFGPLPYYAYGPRRSLYWHPKLNRKLFTKMEERMPQQIPDSILLKRSDDQTNEVNEAPTSNPTPPVPKDDELAIAFLTPGKEQISAFKKKIEELKNVSISDSAKAQMFADEMEKFNAKPSIITMGYKMWNWYKGYKESPAPFYSDPRTFNHPFGNKNKMLKIPPSAFATHYFQQDVPLVTKSTLGKTKSWMDEYNAMPEELAGEDNDKKERSPKCTKGSSMLYCNGDALTDFMNALEKHVRNKKSRPSSYYDSEGTKYYNEYEDDLNQNQMDGREYSSDDYENAKRGYDPYSKGKSKFKSFSPEDISSFNPYRNDNSLDKHFDIDIKDIQGDPSVDDGPMQILVVLTKKDFSGSSSHSRSSSHSKPGMYPPKVVYDTSALIAGKHRPIINTPEAWEDPSLYEDTENHRYSKEDDYYYDKPRKSRSRSRSRSKSSSYKNNKYDKLMDELMNAIEGKIQDMDPQYDMSKDKNHNPSEINNDDYEPAPFWPVPRDFTSEERLKYARMKAAKAHFYGPEVGWFNRE